MVIKNNEIDYLKTSETSYVEKEFFEEMFGDSYDYEELINHEKATERWKEIFSYWKSEGIIN